MVGGESGEGIDTTGELVALTLCRLGYHVFAFRHFPSRIRGGHTNYRVRIGAVPVGAVGEGIDCLVAFDQGSIDWNWAELRRGGMVLHDAAFTPQMPPDRPDLVGYAAPLTELAEGAGSALMKNMAAVGASAGLLGLPPAPFAETVARHFARKGEEIAAANATLVRQGHAELTRVRPSRPLTVAADPPAGRTRYLMSGNDALAYGALAAGCRFLSAYPITPATEVMQWLGRELPAYGGAVVQTEDELAAINMAIGAAYAGARAMTSTSGPGFSLMSEGMGLAGATETPVVILDDQRAGPSTGLPTRTEQADLQHAAFGGHGEFPRVVAAPLTIADCFYAAVDAFNLAERFQCPAILAPDLFLATAKQTIDGIDFSRVQIERGARAEGAALDPHHRFRRYALTESGISPRAFPGQAGGQHLVTGAEHDEVGNVVDTPANRLQQQGKRLRKLAGVSIENATERAGPRSADVVLVGFGSTAGPMEEARRVLLAEGVAAARLSLRVPHPLPVDAVREALRGARAVLMVENNAEGQLERLLRAAGLVAAPAAETATAAAAGGSAAVPAPTAVNAAAYEGSGLQSAAPVATAIGGSTAGTPRSTIAPPAGGRGAAGIRPAASKSLRRFDGNPVRPAEIAAAAREVLGLGHSG